MSRIPDVSQPIRAVAGWVPPLARFGYAAKGVVYLLVGGIAMRASGARGEEDLGGPSKALASLADGSAGRAALAVIAIGLMAHVLWRLVQAALDPEHPEGGAKRLGIRVFYILSAVIYASLAATAWQLWRGNRAGQDDGESHEIWVAKVLSQPFGAWLVMAAGIGVMAYGLHQLIKAAKGDVNRRMETPGGDTAQGLRLVGRLGTAARGLVLLPIGWFVMNAGRRYRAAEAADTGEVLRMLDNGPMLAAVGFGLAAYGLHQVGKALFRRIERPA